MFRASIPSATRWPLRLRLAPRTGEGNALTAPQRLREKIMKLKYVASALGCAAASAALAPVALATSTTYYDASVKRVKPGDTHAYYYNPGPDNAGAADHILFDDVT